MDEPSFTDSFIHESIQVLEQLDRTKIDLTINKLKKLRESHGRLFFVGLGGSASNSQHATNDFRKLTGIEAYSISDNISELTARANDEGLDTIFDGWLRVSNFCSNDALFVLSVGGGSIEKNVSVAICRAVDYCLKQNGKIFAIVGRDGGYVAQKSEDIIIVPTVNSVHVTPHSESVQSIVWHLIVSSPDLKINSTKW